MKGYFRRADATAQRIRNGWLYTGDVGKVEADGYYYHLGRRDDMIITGGLNVYPAEVENLIYTYPGVQETIVFAIPDAKRGQVIGAAIVPRPGATVVEKELLTFSARQPGQFQSARPDRHPRVAAAHLVGQDDPRCGDAAGELTGFNRAKKRSEYLSLRRLSNNDESLARHDRPCLSLRAFAGGISESEFSILHGEFFRMTTWPAAPAELPALERTVHVWAVPLDDARVDLDGGRELLSPDERERAARFHFEQHRRRYLIAHIALHRILSRYLQIDPARLYFELGSNGKPKLPPALGFSGIEFNLSHSNEMALLAVNRIGEVGVDIEYVKPDFKFEEIAERFFTAREAAALRGLPSELQRQAFFKCWTCKEAFLKAKGTGLSGKLDEVEITLGAADRVRIRADVPGWSLAELNSIDAYEAALVVAGSSVPIRYYLWQP